MSHDDNNYAVLVNDHFGATTGYKPADITEAFHQADTRMRWETYGAAHISLENIFHVSVLPEGKTKTADSCYTDSDLKNINNLTRLEHHLGDSVLLHVLLNQKPMCNGALGDAFLQTKPFNAYNPHIKHDKFSPGIILHESGHQSGLSHVTELTCDKLVARGDLIDRQESPRREEDIADFVVRGCSVARQPDSDRENFYGAEGVMGSALPPEDSSAFTPNALNMLLPQRFKVLSNPQPGVSYSLSAEPGGIYGVSLNVSDNDPLKKIDKTISKVVIGLGRHGKHGESKNGVTAWEPNYQIEAEAIGAGQEYKIEYTPAFNGYDEATKHWAETTNVLHDEKMNAVVRSSTLKSLSAPDVLTITVTPLDQAAQAIREQQIADARYNKSSGLK